MSERRFPPPLVVIGGSAGAITPLRRILAELRPTTPAAICVVIHLPDDSASGLARVLARAGTLEASFADDGVALRPAHVVIAPPGNHLLIHDGHTALSQGARENGTRPAIDPLFRTAARAAGADTVSVVLSGTLDDGSSGTAAIRSVGGHTIAQDPSDAEFPDMPRNAIETGQVLTTVPASGIARAIEEALDAIMRRRAASTTGGEAADAPRPTSVGAATTTGPAETNGTASHRATDHAVGLLPDEQPTDIPQDDPAGDPVDRGLHGSAPDLDGSPSPYSCPACGGVLYERKPPDQYLCRLGHRYSGEALGAAQSVVIEDALWTALRTLEESASLAGRVRDRAAARGDGGMELRFEARRAGAQARADRIRALLEGRLGPDGESLDDADLEESEAFATERARAG